MQHILPMEGMRQSDLLAAIVRRIEGLAIAPNRGAAVLSAEGPVLTLLPPSEGAPLGGLLARGLYRIEGRLVDTWGWSADARRLTVPRLPADGASAALYLSVNWRCRNWSDEDGQFDPGAAPAGSRDLPLDAVRLVTEEPVLRLSPGTLAGKDDALFIGQMSVSRQGGEQLDPAVLPPVAEMGETPAIGGAILEWLEPLFSRAMALDINASTGGPGIDPASRHRAGRVGDWAASARQAVWLAGPVPLPRVLLALRADLDRLQRLLGAEGLPASPEVVAEGRGFDLRRWLPTAVAAQALDALQMALRAGSEPGGEGLVLQPEALTVSMPAEGRMSILARLDAPLIEELGLRTPPAGLVIRVEPLQAEHTLRATGSALVHPYLPANRLPGFLGRVPIETDSRGRLRLCVRMEGQGGASAFATQVATLFAASEFRLDLEAGPEGRAALDPVPLKLTIVPVD